MRSSVAAADAILDKRFDVLDHGYVVLTDYMGCDDDIANAARVSNAGQVEKKSTNKGLIRYLLRHRHTSPFEMVEMKFICRMPIFVARQWIRHRTASVNEQSGRYSILKDEFYIPTSEQLCTQSKGNNQGRSEERLSPEVAEAVLSLLREDAESAFRRYRLYLGDGCLDRAPNGVVEAKAEEELRTRGGIAKELARINLPLSTYTEWVWKIDLHNLLHFLGLRLDEHAQWEIRQYADILYYMVKCVAPVAAEAFEDYILNAVTFSRQEILALARLFSIAPQNLQEGHIKRCAADNELTNREVDEFFGKVMRIAARTAKGT